MSYIDQGDLVTVTSAAQISGTVTLEGPAMPYRGEVIGATLASPSDSTADAAGNFFLIEVKVNGNAAAATLNTAVTDVNANSVAFPTVSTNSVLTRFAAGEQITVVITETGTAANIAPGAQVYVRCLPHYDHALTG